MRTFTPHATVVKGIAFSPDGQLLATAGGDGSVSLVSLSEDPALTVFEGPRGEWGSPNLRIAFSPCGKWLVASAAQGGIQIWDVEKRASHHNLKAGPLMTFVPIRNWFLATSNSGILRWDTTNWKPLPALKGGNNFVNGMACDPSGTRLIGDTGELLNPDTGKHLRWLWQIQQFNCGSVIRWSPTGTMVAGIDRIAHVFFDPAEGRKPVVLSLQKKHILDIAFAADERSVITVSNEATAKIWDTTSWQVVKEYAWKVGKLKSVAVSPDGTLCAAGSERGKVVLWDLD